MVIVTVKIDAAPIFGRQISQNIEGCACATHILACILSCDPAGFTFRTPLLLQGALCMTSEMLENTEVYII